MANGDGVIVNGKHRDWWEVFIKAVSVLVIPMLAWMVLMIFQTSTAVAVISGNRFTEDDGDLLERRIDGVEREQARREYWGDDLIEIKETLRQIMRMLEERQ
jgi:hypothetical protein